MSIDNKIEESKQKAIELGIFELVQDVVQNTPYPDAEGRGSGLAGMFSSDRTIKWEGCAIRYWSSGFALSSRSGGTIEKSDGTDLFSASQEHFRDVEVHNFRFGAWVERLRIHAEQLVKAKELAEKQKV